MANSTGSGYLYQNAVLKELARPTSERAQVSLEAPAAEYAAGRAAADAAQQKLAADINYKQAALAESGREFNLKTDEMQREFMERLLFAKDQLSQFSKQNDIATIIGLGNMAVTGAQAWKTAGQLEKQEKMQQDVIDMRKEMTNLARQSVADQRSAFETSRALAEIKPEIALEKTMVPLVAARLDARTSPALSLAELAKTEGATDSGTPYSAFGQPNAANPANYSVLRDVAREKNWRF
jgi:exonuclease VII small subunit